jgi:hypothetical protein
MSVRPDIGPLRPRFVANRSACFIRLLKTAAQPPGGATSVDVANGLQLRISTERAPPGPNSLRIVVPAALSRIGVFVATHIGWRPENWRSTMTSPAHVIDCAHAAFGWSASPDVQTLISKVAGAAAAVLEATQ